jgi:hypothetical protein
MSERSGNRRRDIIANGIILSIITMGCLSQNRATETNRTDGGIPIRTEEQAIVVLPPENKAEPAKRTERKELPAVMERQPAPKEIEPKLADTRKPPSLPEVKQEMARQPEVIPTPPREVAVQPEAPQANFSEPKVLSSVHLDQTGTAAAPKAARPNAVESNPRPVHELSQKQVQDAVESYFQWKDREHLSFTLDFGNVSAAELHSVIGAYVMKSETASKWMLLEPDQSPRPVESMSGKLFGKLPEKKWTSTLHRQSRDLFGAAALVDVMLVLSDRAAVQMFRQLAGERQKRGDSGSREYTFRLKSQNGAVIIELVQSGGKP